ncbi:MAG: MFS transporter [Candidatus Eremiobacteraeota bacterium]|nr:MFS transporter [Candidatus Eremiobacteraeota bacterium]
MMQKFLEMFKPVPDAGEMLTDAGEIKKKYRYWRIRMMYSTFIGYAVFYFVRQNMSIAMPLMEKAMGIGKDSLGLFLTLHKLLYGVSKFLNGILGDRANPRYFMAIGLLMSALMNIFFGFSSSVIAFGIFWMLNGWFQGMGFPPCARTLSHWFSPKERGTKWAMWNSSHQVGAGLILVLAGYLAGRELNLPIPSFLGRGPVFHLAGWQLCFIVPALIAMATAFFAINRLRDTPGSLGLPPVEQYMNDEGAAVTKDSFDNESFKKFLRRHVFGNKYIWYISFANFFVYILRYGFLDWAPSCLKEMKGIPLAHGGWITAGFELFGLVGSVLAGWLTDKYLKSRRAPVCVAYMAVTLVLVMAFWKLPPGNTLNATLLLFALGFFIYGPQFLVGVTTADLASKHAAATAIGLTGFFGYLSGIVSGYGMGLTVKLYGWDGGFYIMIVSAVLAALLFTLCWNARPMHEQV